MPLLVAVFAALFIDFQAAVPPADADRRAVLAAVLRVIDSEDDQVILAARTLDKAATTALREVRPRTILHPNADVSLPLPEFVLVLDRVTVSAESATVTARRGPLPSQIDWTCGFEMTIPLHRADGWTVLPEAAWRTRCASTGPRGLSRDDERLLEAVRLAFTTLSLRPRIRVVADSALSPKAVEVLQTIKAVPPRKEFQDEQYSLKPDVFLVRKLEQSGDLVVVEGTSGPVPRMGLLACGTNWTIKLRHHADGWTFEERMATMC